MQRVGSLPGNVLKGRRGGSPTLPEVQKMERRAPRLPSKTKLWRREPTGSLSKESAKGKKKRGGLDLSFPLRKKASAAPYVGSCGPATSSFVIKICDRGCNKFSPLLSDIASDCLRSKPRLPLNLHSAISSSILQFECASRTSKL